MKKNVTLDQIKLLYASIMRKVKEISSIGKAGSGGNSVILNNNSNRAEGEFSLASGNNTVASAADAHAEGRLTQATGICSHAEGMESKATNSSAHAEGYNCTASGDCSHAEGHSCIAEGMHSHTEGYQTHAYGPSSHAEGYDTYAEGNHSHSEGSGTHAEGICAHAEGHKTHAEGNYSHVEGYSVYTKGAQSHAEGIGTQAIGTNSHAEGDNTHAIGNTSHAEGYYCHAEGIYSHAEGYKTEAKGEGSHAEGNSSHAEREGSHVEGYNTWAKSSYAHAEGSNTSASGESSHAEGSSSRAEGKNSHAEGYSTYAKGEASHAEGYSAQAEGYYSHAESFGTKAKGSSSHAEGYGTQAEGDSSHAEGSGTYAKGYASHAEGSNTIAEGSYSHVEGYGTYAKGTNAHTEGEQTEAIGTNSHAEGYDTHAEGEVSHVEGYNTNAKGNYSHAEGSSTSASGEASHAEGRGSGAIGKYSHAEGYLCTSFSEGTHTEGYVCQAYSPYQHVQGKYNILDDENKYAHIVGNGSDEFNKSNAHTLDWEGNAEFAGDVVINGCGGENPISLKNTFEDKLTIISKPNIYSQTIIASSNYNSVKWYDVSSEIHSILRNQTYSSLYLENPAIGSYPANFIYGGSNMGGEYLFYTEMIDGTDYQLRVPYSPQIAINITGVDYSVEKEVILYIDMGETIIKLPMLKEITIPDNIPKIQSAEVGQILEVNQIDENKKPISWIVNDKPMRYVPVTPFIIHGDLNNTEKIVNSNMPLLIQDLTSTNQSTITNVLTPESLLDTWAEQNTNYTMYNLIGKAKMLNVKYNVPATLNFNAAFLKTLNVSKLDTYNFEFINPSNIYKITVITKLNTLSEENAILYPTVGVYITMLASEESTILTYVSTGIVQTMTLDEVLIDKNIARKSWVENITNNKITAPLSAEVNEILVVQEIDENGTPIKWTTISIENLAIEVQNILNNVI